MNEHGETRTNTEKHGRTWRNTEKHGRKRTKTNKQGQQWIYIDKKISGKKNELSR